MTNNIQNKEPDKQIISTVINYFNEKKYKEAQFLAEKISKDFPLHPISWRILGVLYLLNGELSKALIANQQAVKLTPNSPDIYSNLSITLHRLGKFRESIKNAKTAIMIDPNFHLAYGNLSDSLKAINQFHDASLYLKKAIKINPKNIAYYASLAEVLHKLGKIDDALLMNQQAIDLNPKYYQSYLNKGNLLIELKKFKEAENTFNKVIKINPNLAIAYYNLANLQKTLNRFNDAIINYYRAIDINPNLADIHYNLANTFTIIGETNKANFSYKKAIEITPNNPKFHSNKLLNLNYNPDFEQKYIYEQHLLFDKQFSINKPIYNSKTKNKNSNQRLRIGYVSPDFRRHSVSFFFEPLIKNHNKKLVETFCYYNNKINDETTKRLKYYCKNWRSINDKTNDEVIQLIQDDGIDILVDLCGHMAGNRLLVFASKPAPLQISYLGYPNTTGLSAIDYRITDKIADPEESSDLFYSERLIRVSKSFLCYTGNDKFNIKDLPPSHINNFVTFGSFNNFTKINSKVIKVWSNILRLIPKSKLILKNSDANSDSKFILNKFSDEGIDVDNITIYNKIPDISDHMNLYNNIDIALDTFPFNGATTTFEALWMGVPVITFLGEKHASRVSSSILHNLDLENLVAKDIDDYQKKVIEISNNGEYLKELRSELRSRMKNSCLCDGKSFTSEIEKIYRHMWSQKS